MQIKKVAILIVATLAVWNQEAIANSQPPTQTDRRHIVPPATFATPLSVQKIDEVPFPKSAQYGDYLTPTGDRQPPKERSQTVEVAQKVVRDVQIRFVNDKGKPVDDKGRPIAGRTRKDFVIGTLRLKPGEVFREDVLEKDLQRLRRLESFENVKVSLKENEDGVVIFYDIQERRYPSYVFGGGNAGDIGLFGSVGYRDANISGVGDRLNLNFQVSTKDVQFNHQFTSPYRSGEPNRLGYSVRAFRNRDFSRTFTDDIKLANGSRAREGRFGGGAALLRSSGDWDGALGVNYTRISVRDGDYNVARRDRLGSPVSVSGTGIDDLVTVSFALTRDRRDRRDTPTQGSILTLSTDQSLPIGLGSITSNRLQGNYIQYVPVRLIGNSTINELPEMVAFNFQAGTTLGTFPPADAFDLGGLNSVRGYDRGQVASGRSYGLASVEYRFPLLRLGGGLVRSLGGVVFADVASDFGTGKTVLGQPGVLRNKPGDGYGYGLGVRLNTQFALIRGDLGVSNRGEVRFEITTGQRF